MPEATIEINKGWTKDEASIQGLMERLHGIVAGGTKDGPFKKESGYRWQLDGSNDHWADVEDGKLVLAERYSQEKLDALVNFCKVWLS